ncbi:DUF4328 domain-containing protein [Streptomyces cyaneus]|uniref:DUF4328 domain-containing protein n=1 Tax=Streptomyces cyaneus TaxID=1904 RepID=UPI001FE4D54B|nr:DUF4328 domain-containing protein [Streptomyces cyaneus]
MSESSDLRPRPLLPAGAPVSSLGLLVAAVAGLALVAFCDLFSLFAGFRFLAVIDGDGGFFTAPQQELDAAAALYETAGRYQAIVYVPAAIVFVVWFFRMRRNTGLLAPDRFRNGPGWAIGAWLIPLVNLWLPYRIALDMWGAATPLPAEGERFRARTWPVNLWWGLFVFSVLFDRYEMTKYRDAETLMEIRDAVVQYMTADAVHIAAAAAAMYFAVRLTTMQRLKAIEGP